MDVFEGHSKSSKNIQSVADMLNFVENFSEFSAAQRNAGKHVTLMSEMSRLVDQRSLMQVGLADLSPAPPPTGCGCWGQDPSEPCHCAACQGTELWEGT